jgi:hypothetical protein
MPQGGRPLKLAILREPGIPDAHELNNWRRRIAHLVRQDLVGRQAFRVLALAPHALADIFTRGRGVVEIIPNLATDREELSRQLALAKNWPVNVIVVSEFAGIQARLTELGVVTTSLVWDNFQVPFNGTGPAEIGLPGVLIEPNQEPRYLNPYAFVPIEELRPHRHSQR